MSGADDISLSEGFEPADYDAWRATVDTALKGADFEKALTTPTYDGFHLQPLYTKADVPNAPLRPGSGRGVRAGAWDISQAVMGPLAADVAGQAAEELAGGATSVLLRLDACLRAGETPASRPDLVGVNGAALHSRGAFMAAFKGIDCAATPIALDAGAAGLAAAKALLAAAGSGGLAAGASLALDPISAIATAGLPADAPAAWAAEARNFDLGPGVACFRASSLAAFNAGASEAQALGAMLAGGLAYLRLLEGEGLSVADAAACIDFQLALSQDQFLTIASVRAARTLWATALRHAGVDAAPMRLVGVTAERMFTRHDPHVNVLRATIAGFAGAVGGLDGLTVLPFDARAGGDDPLARRVARNLQIVLAEESNLSRVADPAGGAFYVERLTEQLASAAWAEFQAIEQAGDLVQAIVGGSLPARIRETAALRAGNAAKRREAITGVSEYANLDEPARPAMDREAVRTAARADWQAGEPLVGSPMASSAASMPLVAASAPYEALRDASDRQLAATGKRPSVFLANIGALAAFSARATFAANAFAAGGIVVAGNGGAGYADASAMAAAFQASEAKIACICGTDASYGEHGSAFAAALKSAGARQVWLAGRGGASEAALRAAGVDDFLFMGADILVALTSAHRLMGA